MAADEEVAVAEPVEAPDPEASIPAPTDEAVPAPEQEQAEETFGAPDADSGAEEGDEAVPEGDDLSSLIEQALEVMPKEKVEEIIKGKVEQPPDVSEERVQWELEQAKEQREKQWTDSFGTYVRTTPQAIRPTLERQFQQQNEMLTKAANDVLEGNLKPEQLQLNTQAWLDQILLPTFQTAQNAAEYAAFLKARNDAAEAIESDEGYRTLSADQRKAYREARDAGNTQEMLGVVLKAMRESRPETVEQKKAEAAKEQAKANEIALKLKNAIGNGRRPSGGGAPTQYKDIDDAEEAYNNGDLSHEQYKKLREKFGVKDTYR